MRLEAFLALLKAVFVTTSAPSLFKEISRLTYLANSSLYQKSSSGKTAYLGVKTFKVEQYLFQDIFQRNQVFKIQ